jgi:hypothetical protein
MAGRNYGTDPYGIIARGDPSANAGPSVSVGRVGNSMRDLSGRSVGSGVGATVRVPIKTVSKAKGGPAKKASKTGLYSNINAKRERIAGGSGETMRKPGSKGAPTKEAFKQSAKTASSGDRSVKAYGDMIKKAAGGKVQTSSDTARKLATEMGGMKKGGKPKNGLAVMIAIGQPMKKPVKKARGGAGKVRKGMMSPSGDMLQPVKPKAGLGSSY